jgi:hypothetical protein
MGVAAGSSQISYAGKTNIGWLSLTRRDINYIVSIMSVSLNNKYIFLYYLIHHDQSSIFMSVLKTVPVQAL